MYLTNVIVTYYRLGNPTARHIPSFRVGLRGAIKCDCIRVFMCVGARVCVCISIFNVRFDLRIRLFLPDRIRNFVV